MTSNYYFNFIYLNKNNYWLEIQGLFYKVISIN